MWVKKLIIYPDSFGKLNLAGSEGFWIYPCIFSNSKPLHGLSVFAVRELEGLDVLQEDKPPNYGVAILI